MSITNQKREGNKGGQFPYNSKVLKGLQKIADNTDGIAALSPLMSALITAVTNHQEFELKLVRDDANGTVVIQRNEYDETTSSWNLTYVDVIGDPYVFVGSPEYLDPEATLLLMLTELQQINADIDVALSTRASEATSELIRLLLVSSDSSLATIKGGVGTDGAIHGPSQAGVRALGTDGTNDQQLSTDADGQLQIDVLTSALPTGAATEANQTSILNAIGSLNVSKTATSVVTTGTHNVPVGATEVSIFNNGTGDGTVNGTKIPAGVTRTFAFKNPLAAIIACDGGGTEELIIDYMV